MSHISKKQRRSNIRKALSKSFKGSKGATIKKTPTRSSRRGGGGGGGVSSGGGGPVAPAPTSVQAPAPSKPLHSTFKGIPGTSVRDSSGRVTYGGTPGASFKGSISSGSGARRVQTYVGGVKVSDTDRVKLRIGGTTRWVVPQKASAIKGVGRLTDRKVKEIEKKTERSKESAFSKAQAKALVEEQRRRVAKSKGAEFVPLASIPFSGGNVLKKSVQTVGLASALKPSIFSEEPILQAIKTPIGITPKEDFIKSLREKQRLKKFGVEFVDPSKIKVAEEVGVDWASKTGVSKKKETILDSNMEIDARRVADLRGRINNQRSLPSYRRDEVETKKLENESDKLRASLIKKYPNMNVDSLLPTTVGGAMILPMISPVASSNIKDVRKDFKKEVERTEKKEEKVSVSTDKRDFLKFGGKAQPSTGGKFYQTPGGFWKPVEEVMVGEGFVEKSAKGEVDSRVLRIYGSRKDKLDKELSKIEERKVEIDDRGKALALIGGEIIKDSDTGKTAETKGTLDIWLEKKDVEAAEKLKNVDLYNQSEVDAYNKYAVTLQKDKLKKTDEYNKAFDKYNKDFETHNKLVKDYNKRTEDVRDFYDTRFKEMTKLQKQIAKKEEETKSKFFTSKTVYPTPDIPGTSVQPSVVDERKWLSTVPFVLGGSGDYKKAVVERNKLVTKFQDKFYPVDTTGVAMLKDVRGLTVDTTPDLSKLASINQQLKSGELRITTENVGDITKAISESNVKLKQSLEKDTSFDYYSGAPTQEAVLRASNLAILQDVEGEVAKFSDKEAGKIAAIYGGTAVLTAGLGQAIGLMKNIPFVGNVVTSPITQKLMYGLYGTSVGLRGYQDIKEGDVYGLGELGAELGGVATGVGMLKATQGKPITKMLEPILKRTQLPSTYFDYAISRLERPTGKDFILKKQGLEMKFKPVLKMDRFGNSYYSRYEYKPIYESGQRTLTGETISKTELDFLNEPLRRIPILRNLKTGEVKAGVYKGPDIYTYDKNLKLNPMKTGKDSWMVEDIYRVGVVGKYPIYKNGKIVDYKSIEISSTLPYKTIGELKGQEKLLLKDVKVAQHSQTGEYAPIKTEDKITYILNKNAQWQELDPNMWKAIPARGFRDVSFELKNIPTKTTQTELGVFDIKKPIDVKTSKALQQFQANIDARNAELAAWNVGAKKIAKTTKPRTVTIEKKPTKPKLFRSDDMFDLGVAARGQQGRQIVAQLQKADPYGVSGDRLRGSILGTEPRYVTSTVPRTGGLKTSPSLATFVYPKLYADTKVYPKYKVAGVQKQEVGTAKLLDKYDFGKIVPSLRMDKVQKKFVPIVDSTSKVDVAQSIGSKITPIEAVTPIEDVIAIPDITPIPTPTGGGSLIGPGAAIGLGGLAWGLPPLLAGRLGRGKGNGGFGFESWLVDNPVRNLYAEYQQRRLMKTPIPPTSREIAKGKLDTMFGAVRGLDAEKASRVTLGGLTGLGAMAALQTPRRPIGAQQPSQQAPSFGVRTATQPSPNLFSMQGFAQTSNYGVKINQALARPQSRRSSSQLAVAKVKDKRLKMQKRKREVRVKKMATMSKKGKDPKVLSYRRRKVRL